MDLTILSYYSHLVLISTVQFILAIYNMTLTKTIMVYIYLEIDNLKIQ